MDDQLVPSRWDAAVKVFRWAALLPGTLLVMVAAAFPIHWLVLIRTALAEDDGTIWLSDLPPVTLERFALNFAFPWIFVAVGARIAPDTGSSRPRCSRDVGSRVCCSS